MYYVLFNKDLINSMKYKESKTIELIFAIILVTLSKI